jgi:hypothetical protein
MRTSFDVPDDMFRKLKVMAAMRGMSMRQLLLAAIEHEISRAHSAPRVSDEVNFPLLDSKEPGTLRLSNSDIDDLLT